MTALALIFAGALAIGLLGFAAWTIRVFVTTDLAPDPDPTTWLIYNLGRGLIWLAALLVAGGILGGAAAAVWKIVNG